MQLNAETVREIRKSSRTLVREFGFFQTHYANTSATHGESHALVELNRLEELEVSELGRILNMEKTSASKLLAQMEKKGWVQIIKAVDGRKKIYALSNTGKKQARKVEALADERMQSALLELHPAQISEVQKSLYLLSEGLRISRARAQFKIRLCQKQDDKAIASIVKRSLKDLGFDGPGTAAADTSVNHLSTFNKRRSCYFVAEAQEKIFGGAGITEMEGESSKVCELVRMFLHPEARSSGLAQLLIDEALRKARKFGYEICYLETTKKMQAAQRLYLKNGFNFVKNRRGATGHFACTVLMERRL